MTKAACTATRTSDQEAIERFDSPQAASKYARSLVGSRTHRREERCISRGLQALQPGSAVLDLPCGTGRLTPLLSGLGFRVTSADSSRHMVELARQAAQAAPLPVDADAFVVTNVMQTPFADGQFDAVVCNRLFHHFREPDVRQLALKELRRICRGPIVVSFFCSLALDALTFHIKQLVSRTAATDRIPISYRAFANDASVAGLRITSIMPTRPGISKQWYLVLRRADGST